MRKDALFLTHSRYDKEELNFMQTVAARAHLQTIAMEFEDTGDNDPGSEIRDIIHNRCAAVIVLLGPNLANPPSPEYTRNWSAYETGIAASLPIPIWVLKSSRRTILFPVPFVNNYVQYDMYSSEHIRQIGAILRRAVDRKRLNPPAIIRCVNERCKSIFNCWSRPRGMVLYCPVCKTRNDLIDYEQPLTVSHNERLGANTIHPY